TRRRPHRGGWVMPEVGAESSLWESQGWARFRHWYVALELLPPEHAEVLRRWHLLDGTRAEVAAVLGVASGTVSYRRDRALLELVVALKVLGRLESRSGAR